MFTGIVEGTGTVRAVEERRTTRRFHLEAPWAGELRLGDSVAVDGACLTVVERDADTFAVEVIGTTLERTVAGGYASGTRVNLERALRMNGRIDGHLVQGHVDGVGELMQIREDGEFWLIDVRIPLDVARSTILHGSITLNGVSLTVSEQPAEDVVRIGLIPHTWDHTNLGDLSPGDRLNVEGDLIGKYVERILAHRTTPHGNENV